MATFADAFKELRLEKNLTQKEYAKKLGLSLYLIQKYEKGSKIKTRVNKNKSKHKK